MKSEKSQEFNENENLDRKEENSGVLKYFENKFNAVQKNKDIQVK